MMEQSMVTITLEEYNRLRDDADMKKILLDKLIFLESRFNILQDQFYMLKNTQK